jgi:hypothetical protein
MSKRNIFQRIRWRRLLALVILTILQGILAWVVYQRVPLFERWYFGDVLLTFGALDGAIGGLAMIRSMPYSANTGPFGVPAFPVQASEDERHHQLMDELKSQKSFGGIMFGTALLTILVSLAVTYL